MAQGHNDGTARADTTFAVSVVVLTLAFTTTILARQAAVPPRPIEGATPQPEYPVAARHAGIEGRAHFRAVVRPDGSVASVSVMVVPASGMGFEEAVEQAVRRWRFEPATFDGAAVVGTYVGQVSFTLNQVLPGEFMFARRPPEVWAALRTLVKELRLGEEKRDDERGLLITSPTAYGGRGMPETQVLRLPPSFSPRMVQLHVWVAPAFEPARVAIGSLVSAANRLPVAGRTFDATFYSPERLSEWLAARLAERLGVEAHGVPADAERRASRSRKMLPSSGCAATTAPLLERKESADFTPSVVSRIQPLYPAALLRDREQGEILLEGEITEHGTLADLKVVKPLDAPREFQIAAREAAALWRFAHSAKVKGCPPRVRATISMSFVVRR